MQIKISTSIGDFPVFSAIEDSFKAAKEANVDGLELIIGFKSRWHFEKMIQLSKKYDLPITSLHQPYWSGLGIAYDEGFVKLAVRYGIKNIVFHPLCFTSILSRKMTKYFRYLSSLQKKYGITVMLENMPYSESFFSLDHWVLHKDTASLDAVLKVVAEYNFKINYDVSHTELTHPQMNAEFTKIFSRIGNIHLSSFQNGKQHMPLTRGTFDTKGFITYLIKNHYKGLLTFEIFYPKQFPLYAFDYTEIAKSVALIKTLSYKSS
jgi:sugar phosphate isomerase/epimerase